MKRRLIFLALVVIAILAQLGFYHLLTVFGLRNDSELLLLLTIISGIAFWYFPFWYAFIYSKKQKPPATDTEN